MLRPLAIVLGLVLCTACSAIDRGPGDWTIDGTWLATTAELDGEPLPDPVRESITLVVGDGQYTVTVGARPDKGTVTLDPVDRPATLDIHGTEGPNAGRTILAIYERTGDTLRICYDLSGKNRPAEFRTMQGTQLFLVSYRLQTH